MKWPALLIPLAFGFARLSAQARPASASVASPDTAVQAVLALEDGWAHALVTRDLAYFRRYLAVGFIYTEDARTYTRSEVLRDILGDTVTAAHNESMLVHAFGAAAVATGWLIMSGRGANGPFDRRYRFTDVWMRAPGSWQIVAAHDYLVPRSP